MKITLLYFVLCLIFVFGRVTTKRESNSDVLSSKTNIVPDHLSKFPFRDVIIQIPSDIDDDDDDDEQVAASFKKLKYIFDKIKVIRKSLSLVIKIRNAAKQSRKPVLSQKVNRYLQIFSIYQYRKLRRLIYFAQREIYVYYRIRWSLRVKKRKSHPNMVYARNRITSTKKVVRAFHPNVLRFKDLRVSQQQRKESLPPPLRLKVASGNIEMPTLTNPKTFQKLQVVKKDTSKETVNSNENFRKTLTTDKTLSQVHAQKKPTDALTLSKIPNEQNLTSQRNHNSGLNNVNVIWTSNMDDDDEVFVDDVISELSRTEMAEAFQNRLRSMPAENHRTKKINPSNSSHSNQLKSHQNVSGKINMDHAYQFDALKRSMTSKENGPLGKSKEKDESEETVWNDVQEV